MFPASPQFREHCQAANLDVSPTHIVLSSPGASKIPLDSKGLDFLSRLDRTLFAGLRPRKYRCMFHTSGAGKSDEPIGVIRICTIANIMNNVLDELTRSVFMGPDKDNEHPPEDSCGETVRGRFPTDGRLEEIINDILEKEGEVSSLKKMTALVNEELNMEGYERHTTSSRVKRIILDKKLASIKVKVRRWDGHGLLGKCPICSHTLHNEKNVTIYGWRITLKQICPECGYWTDRKKTSVARYRFSSLSKENEE